MLGELSCTCTTGFNIVAQTLIPTRTSPTAYNVFTGIPYENLPEKPSLTDISAAYSITSAYSSGGVCITTSGSAIQVSPAYSEILSSANGRVTLDANGQQSFINYLGFSNACSGGGENVVATALVQITNTTATTTSTFSNVPLAAVVASLTIAPVSLLIHMIRYLAGMYSIIRWTLL